MKVFKFGGASVKDVTSIKNVHSILEKYRNEELLVIFSAMGKTTNMLEKVVENYTSKKTEQLQQSFFAVKAYYDDICQNLFSSDNIDITPYHKLMNQLKNYLTNDVSDNYDFEYDQIVSFGELCSSTIMSIYLNEVNCQNELLDVRKVIKTDLNFREGRVNWKQTEKNITDKVGTMFQKEKIIVTQGFLGSTPERFTTTLGREGSDYSAAIFAYCLNAEDVTIWKDVPGLLNADPKYFPEAVKLEEISYSEAIELAYYGATVIHPKTIKPLQNKGIILNVKSFISPDETGTIIGKTRKLTTIPSYIFKRNQVLISISPKDFSFIAEDNLSDIFALFAGFGFKINLMQNSALSFTVCVDDKPQVSNLLYNELSLEFNLKYNTNMELITIRHYNDDVIKKVVCGRKILAEQKNRTTIQLVVKS